MHPPALNPSEIELWLHAHPAWQILRGSAPEEPARVTSELMRAFRFAAFTDAMAFMQAAAPFIDSTDHHPRWENSFKTVKVWLTTWDLNHTISVLDTNLAEHLETLFQQFDTTAKPR